MSLDKIWLKAKVIEGKKLGRTLGYPTLNLDQPYLLTGKKEGVYACKMKIGGKLYHGALYYGPRLILKEKNNILEIFVFDFTKAIYGQEVSFQVLDYIRPVKKFGNLIDFKKQLESDCRKAKSILLQ
ncbi:hypothetical protein A2960_01330 [Candidatus Gottesmanbacteria bacterium RIFCSPLOWO2_01_FULL_39_12b]|uniref:riboflavin kinase n=1 Tax=Candidatus Gottesmanbacteria bacterium RIFCSPLOWO2_01_FULL_39_12b TaxID=1798388 RepID=A0A1F6AQ33_9BACT|nr:MAG: hypothetical protein A2960_01330 [Candidatus Gottesmanbacteria bacterium RIFCSPLOWO2_01_FULL_39_12b]